MNTMSVTYACQVPVEEEEEAEYSEYDEIPQACHNELLRAYPNRQVGIFAFPLYEKTAAVWQIQRYFEEGNLSIRAACKVSNLHHKQFINWKREIVLIQQRRNKKAKSLDEGPSSVLYPIED